jgi:phosphatidylserine/phosphatidylglycerophosphate/cardiolipin synthase-like enzyme
MIVDDRLAFVGSENFSATSLDQNRELGVIVRQPAAVVRLESTFQHDWG